VWLAFLVPMFFGTYIAALEIVATYDYVPTLVFAWERHLPFLAWTVLPYWSIDFFYGLSLFLCRSPHELSRHARRLVTAQAVAIPIFLLFPLRLTTTIPADTGIWAPFFGALDGMVGKPFNLAPSLHIALLVILWLRYVRHVPWPWQAAVHVWASLIGVSVLTANQHHFFDIPTGAMLGFFTVWAWPEHGDSPLAAATLVRDPRRLALAAAWGAVAVALTALAFWAGGAALWLLWPAQSAGFVALAYGLLGEAAFQKDEHGTSSLAARALLWPYQLAARLNAWAWTARMPASSEVAPGVYLGRLPRASPALAVVDLTAELPGGAAPAWHAVPTLDLTVPSPEALERAARLVETLAPRGVLVACALGLSRSAAVAATWLAAFGPDSDVDAAIARVRAARPGVVLGPGHVEAITAAVARVRASS
jgi:protein-tyrosine phosphatase